MTLEHMLEMVADDALKRYYYEIAEWKKEGTLPMDATLREFWGRYKETIPNVPIHAMTEPILLEIAKRKYQPKHASVGATIKITGNLNAHQFAIGQRVRVVEWYDFDDLDEKDKERGVEASDGKENWFIRHEDYEVVR